MMACACKAADAYSCWAVRYDMDDATHENVEFDGGPCDCGCHEDALADSDEDWP